MPGLELNTAPTADSITYTEAKRWLRLPDDVDQTDAELIIKRATTWAEGMSGLAIITQTWTQYWNFFPAVIELDKPPVQSITHLKYEDVDGTTQELTEGTDFQADLISTPALIKPEPTLSWPIVESGRFNAVQVKFVAGMADTVVLLDDTNDGEFIRGVVSRVVSFSYENRGEGTLLKIPQDAKDDILSRKWSWG